MPVDIKIVRPKDNRVAHMKAFCSFEEAVNWLLLQEPAQR